LSLQLKVSGTKFHRKTGVTTQSITLLQIPLLLQRYE